MNSFRLLTSQLIDSGACRQKDVIRTFGVWKSSVARASRRYREEGAAAFFQKRRHLSRGGRVLTQEVLSRAQQRLEEGWSRGEVAQELSVLGDTLRKAVSDWRLRMPLPATTGSDKSSRSVRDAATAEGMWTACKRTSERVLAALDQLQGAPACFESCRDIPCGGVLCALPALIENGLLEGVDCYLNRLKRVRIPVKVAT